MLSKVSIRRMIPEDINQIIIIENLSFPTPWSYKSFLQELCTTIGVYYTALNNDDVVGYAGMWMVPGEAHITTVAVHPDYRDKHIGELLMRTLITHSISQGAQTMLLEVRPSNISARKLYKKLGFRQIGIRTNYYVEINEDALIMLKKLTEDKTEKEEKGREER